jgi:hypothetical protein
MNIGLVAASCLTEASRVEQGFDEGEMGFLVVAVLL